jgi:hypothetical protein
MEQSNATGGDPKSKIQRNLLYSPARKGFEPFIMVLGCGFFIWFLDLRS